MNKSPIKRNIASILVLVLVVLVIVYAGVAYARYLETLVFNQEFVAKPLEQVAFGSSQWQVNDRESVLEFTMSEELEACRIYIAVSQGVSNPEALEISLSKPGETEDNTYIAVPEPIDKRTSLYKIFGEGYVFRFYDAETGEEIEWEFNPHDTYTISLSQLDDATEYPSLIRVFVEENY